MAKFEDYQAQEPRRKFKETLFFKAVPTYETFKYFKIMGESEKVVEFQQDLLDMWKYNLEDKFEAIFLLHSSLHPSLSPFEDVF